MIISYNHLSFLYYQNLQKLGFLFTSFKIWSPFISSITVHFLSPPLISCYHWSFPVIAIHLLSSPSISCHHQSFPVISIHFPSSPFIACRQGSILVIAVHSSYHRSFPVIIVHFLLSLFISCELLFNTCIKFFISCNHRSFF